MNINLTLNMVIMSVDVDLGCFSLRDGLTKMLMKYDTCFLTMNSSTCAIVAQNGRYAVVDSHARSVDGMIDETGKSVVLYFTSIDCVYEHISRFAAELHESQKQFEIAGVIVNHSGHSSSTQSDVCPETTDNELGCGFVVKCSVQPALACDDRSVKRKISMGTATSKKRTSGELAAVN